jgi:ribosomal protein S13
VGHFSAYIMSHLDERGITPNKFGTLVGIAKSTAKAICDGTSIPEERTLRKIAAALPALPLARLREEALKDTPFELPAGAELLDLDERKLVRETIRQLLKSSGKAERVQRPTTEVAGDLRKEVAEEAVAAADNVVSLPLPERAAKAAYNPPADE